MRSGQPVDRDFGQSRGCSDVCPIGTTAAPISVGSLNTTWKPSATSARIPGTYWGIGAVASNRTDPPIVTSSMGVGPRSETPWIDQMTHGVRTAGGLDGSTHSTRRPQGRQDRQDNFHFPLPTQPLNLTSATSSIPVVSLESSASLEVSRTTGRMYGTTVRVPPWSAYHSLTWNSTFRTPGSRGKDLPIFR